MTIRNQTRGNASGAEPVRRFIIGIAGATGAIYGIRLLQILKTTPNVETHLVMSKAAERTIAFETEYSIKDVQALASANYNIADIGAAKIGRAHV